MEKEQEQIVATEELLQLVGFKIGEEEFAVDILRVQEIIKMIMMTKVPNTPEYVKGVINLRGRIIPVIDLRKRLGLKEKEADQNSRIIVVEIEENTIGFIVDEVSEVLRIPQSIIEPPPSMVGDVNANFITAVAKLENRLLILLDLEKILVDEKEAA